MKRKAINRKRIVFFILGGFLLLLICLVIYLALVAVDYPPKINESEIVSVQRMKIDENCFTFGPNWIRKSESGLWEMYVEGDAYERGLINGELSKELIYQQEKAFTDQIIKMVPSTFYRHFLKYFVAWFNRDLDENITEEYKKEIFGVSRVASEEFDYIGSAYQRMMNYHAAHDIGHALQNLALVGCSSFATWNDRSKDSLLLLGRNFDFYVGDKFAENKIVYFCNPKVGNKFMMLTWGGLIGVVSGMNMKGLTITLNAAKSEIPSGSATPVSILAREILQYAGTIEEAVSIAEKRRTFVSESFMIGSAVDNRAVVIEKTPELVDVYDENASSIVCTNHYQGRELFHQKDNLVQMSQSASVSREERIRELLSRYTLNTPLITATILRDQFGRDDKFIGYGNEKAVNQLISHHSIIFEPANRIVWVSTAPWTLGKYVAYDLNKIFQMDGMKENHEICEDSLTIPADPFLLSDDYKKFLSFREMKAKIQDGLEVDLDRLISSNPQYYDTYVLAGDQAFKSKNYDMAIGYYMTGLGKEIASKTEEMYLRKQVLKCEKKKLEN
ncbi:MAG TPA: C45 family autoproteolytic acyltransferase/hydrolase [Bacteroidia bacterium]|nr:C45 family autoproteolytic acyltransferase/hydrolase [Bacteroidia bacterium]HNS11578.1 C45 family autoproteolytic acyltransferase/hydrolase [Bacteroidia bacterium]